LLRFLQHEKGKENNAMSILKAGTYEVIDTNTIVKTVQPTLDNLKEVDAETFKQNYIDVLEAGGTIVITTVVDTIKLNKPTPRACFWFLPWCK
jgi:hypothetical protein